jgi:hypothetical protein
MTLIMVTFILAVYDAKKVTVEHMGQEIETSMDVQRTLKDFSYRASFFFARWKWPRKCFHAGESNSL